MYSCRVEAEPASLPGTGRIFKLNESCVQPTRLINTDPVKPAVSKNLFKEASGTHDRVPESLAQRPCKFNRNTPLQPIRFRV